MSIQPRPRPTTSCLICRQRKVKCDRTHPSCNVCQRHGLQCVYAGPRPEVRFVSDSRQPVEMPHSTVLDRLNESAVLIEPSKDGVHVGNRYLGSPFWGVVSEDSIKDDLKWLLRQQSADPTIYLGALPSDELSLIMQLIPERYTCEMLVTRYLQSVHPLIPVCYGPTLQKMTTTFWSTDVMNSTLDTLTLLAAVLYAGANTSSLEVDPKLRNLETLVQVLFRKLDFPGSRSSASLPLLQAYLVFNSFRACEAQPLSAYGFLPQAIRMAQSMGLHREVEVDSEVEAEVRRNIWWHLVYLDIEGSISSGLPTMIHEGDYTCKMPGISDDAIRSFGLTDIPYSQDPKSMMTALRGRCHWAVWMHRWVRRGAKEGEKSELRRKIDELHESMPFTSNNEWARTYLLLQYDRAICIGAKAFLSPKTSNPKEVDVSLLKSCHSFLRNYISLARSPMVSFQWYIPGLIHPLHATMILLLHLYHYDDLASEKAQMTRYAIEDIIKLVGNRAPNGDLKSIPYISRGSGHPLDSGMVYCLVGRLMARVWKRAGWAIPCRPPRDCMYLPEIEGVDQKLAPEPLEDKSLKKENKVQGMVNGADMTIDASPDQEFNWDEWDQIVNEFFTDIPEFGV